jgi:hypothetical protein
VPQRDLRRQRDAATNRQELVGRGLVGERAVAAALRAVEAHVEARRDERHHLSADTRHRSALGGDGSAECSRAAGSSSRILRSRAALTALDELGLRRTTVAALSEHMSEAKSTAAAAIAGRKSRTASTTNDDHDDHPDHRRRRRLGVCGQPFVAVAVIIATSSTSARTPGGGHRV